MRSIAWLSDSGQTFVFDSDGPFFYGSLESTLGATAETDRAPRQDGQNTRHVSLDPPGITFNGAMWIFGDKSRPALAEFDQQKSLLCQAFSPNRWGTLIYYREDGAWQIRCRPVALPTFSKPSGTFATLEIDFTADTPYWETATEHVVGLGVNMKLIHFPMAFVKGPFGSYDRFATINNETAEDIYPTLEVYTTGQYVTLTNLTTDRSVKIEHAIADNQKLVVDLRDVTAILWTKNANGDYTISEDVSHWMSLASDPWWITPGINRVAIYNDVPEDTPLSFIRYRVPRVGV